MNADSKFHPQLSSNEKLINREQALLLYCTNSCDVEKTAFSLGIEAVKLQRVVDDEKWDQRLGAIRDKIKSESPGSVERGINRSLNFVIAHRFRLVLERALQVMENWTDDDLIANLTPPTTDKFGNMKRQVSTRWAADFSSALEKMAAMSYQSTNDSATERTKRVETDGGESKIDIHQKIAQIMSGVGESKTPRALLLDAQLEVAQSVVFQAAIPRKPVPPPDDTFVDESGG